MLFGESAGSYDTCTHVVSPLSRGLFRGAIGQSGSCLVGVNTAAEAATAAGRLPPGKPFAGQTQALGGTAHAGAEHYVGGYQQHAHSQSAPWLTCRQTASGP